MKTRKVLFLRFYFLIINGLILFSCSSHYMEPTMTADLKKGKAIVYRDCAICHVDRLRDAPLLGDDKAWAPRIAQGEDTLLAHAISGYKQMPERGANPELSDDDLLLAIRYMIAVSKP